MATKKTSFGPASSASSQARPARSKGVQPARQIDFALPLGTEPMEAKSAASLPEGENLWQYEPKWDGFRCIAFKAGTEVELRAKSGKPLGRYFPEVVAMLRDLAADRFVVDGELVIELDGRLAFRRPANAAASGRKAVFASSLAKFRRDSSPSTCSPAPDGALLIEQPLSQRRRALQTLHGQCPNPEGLRPLSRHDRARRGGDVAEYGGTGRHRWGSSRNGWMTVT